MRITVGRKLGLGFGGVIALMACCTAIAYYKLEQLDSSVRVALDQSYPSALTCRSLVGQLRESISLLRGIRIRVDSSDEENVDRFKTERAAAWRKIDENVAELESLSKRWDNVTARDSIGRLAEQIAELRGVQQKVVDISQSPQNNRPMYLLETDVLPLLGRMRTALIALRKESMRDDAARDRNELIRSIGAVEVAALAMYIDLRTFAITGSVEARQATEAQWRAFQDAHTAAEAGAASMVPVERQYWDDYVASYKAFEPLPQRLISLREAEDWNQANHLMLTQGAGLEDQITESVRQLESMLVDQAERHGGVVIANAANVSMTLIIGSLLSMSIACLVAFGLSRKIVSVIQAVSGAARKMADGDLTGSDLVVRAQDELADLAAAFNTMRTGLRDVAGQVRGATENVTSTAAEILASTQQQAAATKEQAASIQEITSTVEEINQSGSQISERAQQISAVIEAASAVTQRGMTATQDTSQTMEAIRDQVEEVAETVVGLSERTQTIGEIIATVSEIAEQSNLLALNASIEAVSAGQQGGRFSVVAHEMKNLADRAKECTVQVRTILGEIQKGINASVMFTEEAVKRADGGKQQSHDTESTIRQVAETNSESVQAFQQIVAGANQQRIGVGQVTQGMQDIRQAVQQTASGTLQLEKAAANMNALSQQLRRLVEQYRI